MQDLYNFTVKTPTFLPTAEHEQISFDGVMYTAPKVYLGSETQYFYGELDNGTGKPVFDTYPFAIVVAPDAITGDTMLAMTAATGGTHTVAFYGPAN